MTFIYIMFVGNILFSLFAGWQLFAALSIKKYYKERKNSYKQLLFAAALYSEFEDIADKQGGYQIKPGMGVARAAYDMGWEVEVI